MTHNLLKGKRGIIFGALNEDSIAWKVAVKAVEEGATITLSNTPMALRMGELDGLSKQLNAPVIPADATSVEDLEKVFSESVKLLGGKIDFVLHSIGMSPNVRDGVDTHVLLATVDITKAAGDTLEHTLGVGHVVVSKECTLRGNVCEGYHRTIFGDGILLLCHLKHLVE